ncbi:aldo/keto reductase family oxidoreductase, partial [Staphylococcus aureus]|nr:aldo/keto reductase family oxidoreductase [Staphylococcus aureus]
MKKITLGKSDLQTGAISLGCMRMHRLSVREAQEVIENALEVGVDLFDHADIY